MVCTGGDLAFLRAASVRPSVQFVQQGNALANTAKPQWLASGNRWAPEVAVVPGGGGYSILVVCDDAGAGSVHRIGIVASNTACSGDNCPAAGAYGNYAGAALNLGGERGGDIDAHLFNDDNGRSYLAWKTDDNNAGSKVCRLWLQEVHLTNSSLTLVGNRAQVLDSTGLWWAPSFVAGGGLIEGPEIVKFRGYYYLFFAAGKYCSDTYTEGVARSKSIFGPYEKMMVPLLSTGIVGFDVQGRKLIGPGHACFVWDDATQTLVTVFAASPTAQCSRHAYSAVVRFGADDWPYVDF